MCVCACYVCVCVANHWHGRGPLPVHPWGLRLLAGPARGRGGGGRGVSGGGAAAATALLGGSAGERVGFILGPLAACLAPVRSQEDGLHHLFCVALTSIEVRVAPLSGLRWSLLFFK